MYNSARQFLHEMKIIEIANKCANDLLITYTSYSIYCRLIVLQNGMLKECSSRVMKCSIPIMCDAMTLSLADQHHFHEVITVTFDNNATDCYSTL